MVKKLIFSLSVATVMLYASQLHIVEGEIDAHTEVFGDSSINPSVKKIHSDLRIENNDPTTLKGRIWFSISDFRSDNSERDEHMGEMFEQKKYPYIALDIEQVSKEDKNYTIKGTLQMHGTKKSVVIPAEITKKDDTWHIVSYFHVKVSDYGMEPPQLLFLSVRDRVDVHADLTLKE